MAVSNQRRKSPVRSNALRVLLLVVASAMLLNTAPSKLHGPFMVTAKGRLTPRNTRVQNTTRASLSSAVDLHLPSFAPPRSHVPRGAPSSCSLPADQKVRDAVVLYVSGNDPRWQRQFEHYRESMKSIIEDDSATERVRFRDNGELLLNLKALALHAPWLERVFVVVASPSEVPEAVVNGTAWPFHLEVLTHAALCASFAQDTEQQVLRGKQACADVLPTFSSSAIELLLGFTDAVDDTFLYLNDDMFLCGPLQRQHLFNCDEQPSHSAKHREAFPAVFYERNASMGLKPAASFFDDRPFYVQKLEWNAGLARDALGAPPAGSFAHAPRLLSRAALREISLRFVSESRATLTARFRRSHDLLPTMLHGEIIRRRFRRRVAPVFLQEQMADRSGGDPCSCAVPLSYGFVMPKSPGELLNYATAARSGDWFPRDRPGMLSINDEFDRSHSDVEVADAIASTVRALCRVT